MKKRGGKGKNKTIGRRNPKKISLFLGAKLIFLRVREGGGGKYDSLA